MNDRPSTEWHYHTAATGQQGPVEFAVLQGLARLGRLAPGDLVWTDGMADWTPASQVAGLHKAVPPPLPASLASAPASAPTQAAPQVAPVLPHTVRIAAPPPPDKPAPAAGAAASSALPPPDAMDYSPFARQPRDYPPPVSANYLARHWRGELPLPLAFWVNGTLLYLALKGLAYAAAAALSYSTPLSVIWAVVIGIPVVSIAFQVWSLVGIWRSAERYKAAGGEIIWGVLAQVAVGIIVVLIAISLFSLMSLLGGSRY